MSSTRSAAFHLTWFHTHQQSGHRFGTSASPGHLHLQGLTLLFEMHSNNASPSPLPYSLHPSIQCTLLPALKQPNVTSGCEASKAPLRSYESFSRWCQITDNVPAGGMAASEPQLLHENGLAFDPLVLGLHRGIRIFYLFFFDEWISSNYRRQWELWYMSSDIHANWSIFGKPNLASGRQPRAPPCRCLTAKCGIVAQVDLYRLTNFYHRAKKTCPGLPEASR